MNAPTRPALRYYGGKWRAAPWIISHFPPHLQYVEPCGGAASVLLQKKPAKLETYNDLDSRVVNFFQVLREQPEDLIHLIELTPWAREEWERCHEPTDEPLELARRFWTLCWQSFSKIGGSWRCQYQWRTRPRQSTNDGINIEHLYQVAARFKRVQIEHRPALQVVDQYAQPETLIYFDPPYLQSVRANPNYYQHEVDQAWHVQAAELLRTLDALIVVSGYACPLYTELYEAHGWTRYDSFPIGTQGGASRIESIWLSPQTEAARNGAKQLTLG